MNSQNITANNESQFQRSMQLRHLIMLSLGGVIGSGLFFGTGHIIANVGAFGTVLAYLIGAFMVYLIMLSLGELSVAHPVMQANTSPLLRVMPWHGCIGSTGPSPSARLLPLWALPCNTGSRRCRCGPGA